MSSKKKTTAITPAKSVVPPKKSVKSAAPPPLKKSTVNTPRGPSSVLPTYKEGDVIHFRGHWVRIAEVKDEVVILHFAKDSYFLWDSYSLWDPLSPNHDNNTMGSLLVPKSDFVNHWLPYEQRKTEGRQDVGTSGSNVCSS